MSIQLYFSNRLDKLAEQFASMVDLENRRKENIFKAPLADALLEDDAALIKLVKPEIPSNAFDKARQRFQIFFTK
jgi:hypothetical protein